MKPCRRKRFGTTSWRGLSAHYFVYEIEPQRAKQAKGLAAARVASRWASPKPPIQTIGPLARRGGWRWWSPIEGLKTTMTGTVDFVPVEPFTSTDLSERLGDMTAKRPSRWRGSEARETSQG